MMLLYNKIPNNIAKNLMATLYEQVYIIKQVRSHKRKYNYDEDHSNYNDTHIRICK